MWDAIVYSWWDWETHNVPEGGGFRGHWRSSRWRILHCEPTVSVSEQSAADSGSLGMSGAPDYYMELLGVNIPAYRASDGRRSLMFKEIRLKKENRNSRRH